MSKRKIGMRQIREILRMQDCGCSNRAIARSVKVNKTTVKKCLDRALGMGLNWPLPKEMSDAVLEELLYPQAQSVQTQIKQKGMDYEYIHKELKRKKVTLALLWEEYRAENPHGYGYSRFCEKYQIWAKEQKVWMPQIHKAGEQAYIDYAGMTMPITDRGTGEIHAAQIFVAVLGASTYVFVEATMSQQLPDWIMSHCRAFQYFGGVTEVVIPDNLRSGVNKAHRYEPEENPTYQEMIMHYGAVVMPARVRRPKDKSLAEQAVQQVEHQILAPLRNHRFFSVAELNRAIQPLLEKMNKKPFQKISGSRLSYFEELDKPMLKPLPDVLYKYAEWENVIANGGYLVFLDDHEYSVPHRLARKKMRIRFTKTTVEIFYQNKRIASHKRSYVKKGKTILPEHMPKAHREMAAWTPDKIMEAAKKVGTKTQMLAGKIMGKSKYAYKGTRACLGVIRLEKHYNAERLEAACSRAIEIGACSCKSVESILKNNLDQKKLATVTQSNITKQHHENVRGSEYFA